MVWLNHTNYNLSFLCINALFRQRFDAAIANNPINLSFYAREHFPFSLSNKTKQNYSIALHVILQVLYLDIRLSRVAKKHLIRGSNVAAAPKVTKGTDDETTDLDATHMKKLD